MEKSHISKGEGYSPIDQDKIESCYTPNGETYPLCKGKAGNTQCEYCNLYEDMIGPFDQ